MRIAARALRKALKVEEFPVPVKDEHEQPGGAAAEEAGADAHQQRSHPERRAVNDELRVQQDGCHHECREPVFPHSLFSEGRGDGNRSVHAERRGDAQETGWDDAEDAGGFALHLHEEPVYFVFCKCRYPRPDRHSQDPVPDDLPELEVEVVPDIYEFSLEEGE